jgi:hypothetical protein
MKLENEDQGCGLIFLTEFTELVEFAEFTERRNEG